MAQTATSLGIEVVAHGSDASDHAAEYLAAGFGTVMVGEVETTLLEFAQGKSPDEVAGLVEWPVVLLFLYRISTAVSATLERIRALLAGRYTGSRRRVAPRPVQHPQSNPRGESHPIRVRR